MFPKIAWTVHHFTEQRKLRRIRKLVWLPISWRPPHTVLFCDRERERPAVAAGTCGSPLSLLCGQLTLEGQEIELEFEVDFSKPPTKKKPPPSPLIGKLT